MRLNEVVFSSIGCGIHTHNPIVFKWGVKCRGCSLKRRGQCISTAVRLMDGGAGLSTAAVR